MLSIDWATKVIFVPQADLTPLGGSRYEFDVNAFRLALRDLEDDEGLAFPPTHNHNAQVVLSGVTYADVVEIINGYTVEFEDPGSSYAVICTGANHNIGDVKVVNRVSLVIGNAAGLIVVTTSDQALNLATAKQALTEQGYTTGRAPQLDKLDKVDELSELNGLDPAKPLTVTPTERSTGAITQTITKVGDVVTVQRT